MVRSMHPEVLLLMGRCASICAYHTPSHTNNNQITCDFHVLVAKPTCPCSTCVFVRSARFDAIFAWGSRSQGQTCQSEERFLPKRLRKAWPLGRPLGRPLGCPLGRPLRAILWWNRRKSAFSTSTKLFNFHWRVHWDDLLKGHTCQHTLRGTIANEKHTKPTTCKVQLTDLSHLARFHCRPEKWQNGVLELQPTRAIVTMTHARRQDRTSTQHWNLQ